MLFDTQNSNRKEIILRKMSSIESYNQSMGSPTQIVEDLNSSLVEVDIHE